MIPALGHPMKIVILSSLYGVSGGGAGLVAEQLARGLSERGHDLIAVTTKSSPGREITNENGVKVYRFLPRNLYSLQTKDHHSLLLKAIWQLIDIYNPHTARVLRRILEAEKPDIIHVHKMRGFSSAAWSVSSLVLPGRVIQTLHDYESMSPLGTLKGQVGKWALEKRQPFRLYQGLRTWFSRKVSIVTAPSRYTLDVVMRAGLFPHAHGVVVPNFQPWTIDELCCRGKEDKPHSGALRILYIGRLEPEKGIRELMQAFSKVCTIVPDIHLTVAGWGSLEDEMRSYGNRRQFTFAGRVSGTVKDDLFASVDVVVVPSTWAENSPVVVLEAFANGRPLIASSIGGLPEFIDPGRTGWLVSPGNVSALADVLVQVAQDPGVVRNMFPACFERARDFTKEHVFKQYEQLYFSCIRP